MAIKLASLFIELAANGDKLTAELKKSSKQTQAWQKRIEVSTRAVARSFKVVTAGAALGTTALTALYISNARSLDTLGKTAAKLGDTTEDLKVFGVAAQLGGVGVEQGNTALQRMTRRLAEAAQGSGEAQGAIAELGLDAAALAAKRPSQAFEDIAAALDTVPLAADRVRLAMKFFDSEGVALVNVTTQALEDARRTVDAFGGALTSLEVSQIEAANDSVTRVTTGFDLLTDKMTAKLAPGVKEVADELFIAAGQSQQLEFVFDTLLESSIKGLISVTEGSAALFRYLDGREEIASYGAMGLLLFGKKGLAVGAAAGAIGAPVFNGAIEGLDVLQNGIKGLFGEEDKIESLTDRLEFLRTKLSIRGAPILDSIFGDEGDQNIRDEIAFIESQISQIQSITQSDLGVAVGSFSDETASVFSTLGDGAEYALGSLETILRKLGEVSAISSQNPLISPETLRGDSGGGSGEGGEGGPSDENKNSVREEFIKDALDAEKRFQDTWTFFQNAGTKNRLKILTAENSGALETLSQHSRTMFELNKAVGLANATVYIAEGISASWRLGWPAGAAAAATVALNGAAQIRAITSAKFGAAEIASPTTATTNVSSVNSAIASNDESIADSVAASDTNQVVFFGFHTPGATDEQKADEQARLLQLAQDNDLLVRNSDGGFDYTGSGSSNYVSPTFEAVG